MRPIGVDILDRVVGGITPGLPLVLAGPSGSGRTVLALEIAAAALDQGDVVTLVCGEPPPFVLQQAGTLGLDLEPAVRRGQLVLLEMDARVAALVRTQGVEKLADALRSEEPLASLVVVDPFTALTAELVDEPVLRATVRDFVGRVSPMRIALTLEAERLELQRGLERVLGEVCGAYVRLDREGGSRRTLTLEKTRGGVAATECVAFSIGVDGTREIEDATSHVEETRPAALASPSAVPRPEVGTEREHPAPAVVEAAPASIVPPTPTAPAAAVAGPTRSVGRVHGDDPPPQTVLVVDGDRVARERTAKWLGDRLNVVTAADGFEAMTTILTQRPDLVVLDLVMPRVSGFELLSAFQRAAPEIPLLVVSDRVQNARDRLGPIVLGATDILPKPVERFELVHKVETLLRLSEPAPSRVDPADAEALFGRPSATRVLPAEEFDARITRACAFGERYGLPSSLLVVSGSSSDALDAFVDLADSDLRFEDAILRVSRRRVLVLLVATEPADAPDVMERLCEGLAGSLGRKPRLRWSAVDARPPPPGPGWTELFRSVGSEE